MLDIRPYREKSDYQTSEISLFMPTDPDYENPEIPEIPAFLKRPFIEFEEEQLKITDINTDILEKMSLKTNGDLKYNIYARMRIEDYVNDIKKLKDTLDNVFSK